MEKLTDIQRHVLQGFAETPKRIPETAEEFDAYVEMRDAGYVGYSLENRGVVLTDKGRAKLNEAQP